MSKLNTRALSDCPTFWVSKIEIFFNYRRIARVLKTRVAGGRGEGGGGVKGRAPPESIEILILWNGIFSVLRGNCCLKCSIKQLLFSCLFVFACLRVQVLDPGAHVSFFFFWISVLSILCFCVSIIRIHMIWNIGTDVKIRISSYPDHILVGTRDFKQNRGNPDEIEIVTQILQSSYQTAALRHCRTFSANTVHFN